MAFVGGVISRLAPGSLKQVLAEPLSSWPTEMLLCLLDQAIMSLKHVGMFLLMFLVFLFVVAILGK